MGRAAQFLRTGRVAAWALLALCFACRPDAPDALDIAVGERALAEANALVAAHPERLAGENSRAAAEWIAGRLAGRGAECVDFASPHGTLTNVFVPSPRPTVALLVSHYDTKAGVEGFVGANDGASTVGLLIALAELADLPVALLFTDGEECRTRYSGRDGLQGAWFAARGGHPVPKTLPVLVLDMLGERDWTPGLASNGSPRLNAAVRRAARELGIALGDAGSMVDDHVPFVAEGWQAADLIDFEFGPENAWWHTAEDSPDKLSAESLARAAALVRKIVNLLEKETL